MKLKTIAFGTVSLLILASCGKRTGLQQQAEPQEYDIIAVSKQDAVLQSVYPATIKGKQDVEVRPRIEGFIQEIYVDEGSIVRKGQSLFKIESPQTEQALITAGASVSTAKINVDRLRPLAEKGIISEVQLATAEESYKSAQAVLKNAEEARKWSVVTSQVDGVVGSISYRQGSLVNSGNILTTIANTSDVYAYFSLNEKVLMSLLSEMEGSTQAEKIKNLPEVTLILADGTEYPEKGQIETISGLVNVTTGSANFRAKFANKDGFLRSGISGKVIIPQEVHDVFVIPQNATFQLQDKVLVFKVQGDSVVQAVISAIPLPDGKNYAVSAGLSAGERIIESGVTTLRHGSKIKEK